MFTLYSNTLKTQLFIIYLDFLFVNKNLINSYWESSKYYINTYIYYASIDLILQFHVNIFSPNETTTGWRHIFENKKFNYISIFSIFNSIII